MVGVSGGSDSSTSTAQATEGLRSHGRVFLTAGTVVSGVILLAGWVLGQTGSLDEQSLVETAPTAISPDQGQERVAELTQKDGDIGGRQRAHRGWCESGSETCGAADGPPSGRTYVIQAGDTLSAISMRTGVHLEELVLTNRIQDPDLIYAGASLLVIPTD